MSAATERFEGNTSGDELDLQHSAYSPPNGNFLVKAYVTVRNSDSTVRFESSGFDFSDTDQFFFEGTGKYDEGTPTSISLNIISGIGTFSGRYYVYKLKTSVQ